MSGKDNYITGFRLSSGICDKRFQHLPPITQVARNSNSRNLCDKFQLLPPLWLYIYIYHIIYDNYRFLN